PSLFFSLCLALPVSPLFPYTTLFRSCGLREHLRWCKHGQWQDDHDAKGHLVCTACPPNSLRSAAITLAPKDSSWRERSRASSDKDRKSTRLNSSHVSISYAVFCLKKK